MNDDITDTKLILAHLDDLVRLDGGEMLSPWLTTIEAARHLRCSVRQIDRLTHLGLLPFKRQDPTSSRSPRLYHRKHLTAFLVTGRNPIEHPLTAKEKREVEELL